MLSYALTTSSIDALSEAILQSTFLLIQIGSTASLFVMAVVLGVKSIFNTQTVNYWYSFILATLISALIAGVEFWFVGGIS